MVLAYKLTGLSKTINDTKREMALIDDIIHEVGNRALEYAKENAPVAPPEYADSGLLRDSTKIEFSSDGFTIYNDAESHSWYDYEWMRQYAYYNEYGGTGCIVGTLGNPHPAQFHGYRPFIRPAIVKARNEAQDIYDENVFGKKWYRRLDKR